jgi:carbon-monoxide dehydrogenase medium subunit
MLPKFDYIKPVSTKEAVDFLSQHGKESKILAGGTDLLVLMRAGVVRPRYIVDIKGIRSLKMTEYAMRCPERILLRL